MLKNINLTDAKIWTVAGVLISLAFIVSVKFFN